MTTEGEVASIEHPGQVLIEEIRGKAPKDLSLDEIVKLFLCGDTTVCVYALLLTSWREKRKINKDVFKAAKWFVEPIIYNIRDRYHELWGDDRLIRSILEGEVYLQIRPDTPGAS